jgi:hypothetical protein
MKYELHVVGPDYIRIEIVDDGGCCEIDRWPFESNVHFLRRAHQKADRLLSRRSKERSQQELLQMVLDAEIEREDS